MKKLLMAVLLLALFLLPAAFAAAEGEEPATGTDLPCAHEHTKTTIYFYDSPSYKAVSSVSHRVSGRASVEVECLDCGEILSSTEMDNAEEIRPHSMKKGVCALCGYREPTEAVEQQENDRPGERTLIATPGEDTFFSMTLTQDDFTALEIAHVNTAVVRGENWDSAVALSVKDIRDYLTAQEDPLFVEMTEQQDGSLFVSMRPVTIPFSNTESGAKPVTLRFYRSHDPALRVTFAPLEDDELTEMTAAWQDPSDDSGKGFWFVPYLRDGTYIPLQ